MLENKVAIVTGAAQGIGAGIAREFASNGARVAIFDQNEQKASALVQELTEQRHEVVFRSVDVSDPESVQSGVDSVLKQFGSIEILVNNAGIYPRKPWEEMTLQDWDHIQNTNLRSCFMCSKAVYASMKEGKWGRIINMSSVTFWLGAPQNLVHYISSKGGIIGFTRSLAREIAGYNITVNAITPGAVETEGEKEVATEEDVKAILALQSLQTRVLPVDIAKTALFLASDWARAITGQTINVDAGWHMH